MKKHLLSIGILAQAAFTTAYMMAFNNPIVTITGIAVLIFWLFILVKVLK